MFDYPSMTTTVYPIFYLFYAYIHKEKVGKNRQGFMMMHDLTIHRESWKVENPFIFQESGID